MRKLLAVFAVLLCSIVGSTVAEEWWEYGHFYQIYPRSFKDSNGDGVGDLNGITSRLEFLQSIGVTGVWLSPIFKSPMKDFGYDIEDFRQIDPIFGTMEDFDKLLARAKELDIKVLLDFVPNHSSDRNKWFKASADPNHPEHEKYKDYYVWNAGKLLANGTRVPPSNWLSIFRGSAWTWVESRKAFYLHQFLAEQPDLNYRNNALVEEMKDILRFWLRKGVSGYRCDAVPFLFEIEENADGSFDNEPLSGECSDDPEASCYLNHKYTQDLDETFDMIYQWRRVVDEDEFSDFPRMLMTEAYTSFENNLRYYGRVVNGEIVEYGSHLPFNFDLISRTNRYTKADVYKEKIEAWLNAMPKAEKIHANWLLGNHDNKRTASRYNPDRTDLINILLKTLPGLTVTYYGEEIGMTDVYISWEDTQDPQACRTNPDVFDQFSRDPARTPFQWDSSKNAGFSDGPQTWLPLAENYTECNVKLQESQAKSHLSVLRKLIKLRQHPTLKYGGLEISAVDDDVLVFKRELEQFDSDVFFVALNLGKSEKVVDLSASLSGVPQQLSVLIASIQSKSPTEGVVVDSKEVVLPAEVGLVLFGRN